ncbi:MAG: SDR family oxidoreductase [Acidobacteria bacterium]|nr:SDR family oxidoreductase [Acidobacteriota bacterium]
MAIDLNGRVAIVTGGSRGIGKACVEQLAAAGAEVVFSYRGHLEQAQEVVLRVKRNGGNAIAVKAEVSRPKDCEAITATALRHFGRIDILVNNAGIWEPPDGIAVERLSDAQWARTMRVNLDGTFHCTRAVVPAMKERRWGRIVNISSTAGQRGEELHADYAASKGGIISLTKSLATELGPYGILVNAVAPWWVYTDMSREVLDRYASEGPEGADAGDPYQGTAAPPRQGSRAGLPRLSQPTAGEISPLGRVATPEEVAGPVLFLCSDLATYITGEILNVNGGTILCG